MLTSNQCNYQAKLRLHSTPIQSAIHSNRLQLDLAKRKERQKQKKKGKTDGTLNMHPVCAKVAAFAALQQCNSATRLKKPQPRRDILCHQRRREEAGVTHNYFAHGWLLPRR